MKTVSVVEFGWSSWANMGLHVQKVVTGSDALMLLCTGAGLQVTSKLFISVLLRVCVLVMGFGSMPGGLF